MLARIEPIKGRKPVLPANSNAYMEIALYRDILEPVLYKEKHRDHKAKVDEI